MQAPRDLIALGIPHGYRDWLFVCETLGKQRQEARRDAAASWARIAFLIEVGRAWRRRDPKTKGRAWSFDVETETTRGFSPDIRDIEETMLAYSAEAS